MPIEPRRDPVNPMRRAVDNVRRRPQAGGEPGFANGWSGRVDDMFDSTYGSQLSAAAHRIELRADTVRRRAAGLGAAAAGCAWDGAGASAFRNRSHDTVARLRRAAAGLDDAAAALRRHGARVQAALEVHADEQARAAQELLHRGEHLAEQVHGVLRVIGVVR